MASTLAFPSQRCSPLNCPESDICPVFGLRCADVRKLYIVSPSVINSGRFGALSKCTPTSEALRRIFLHTGVRLELGQSILVCKSVETRDASNHAAIRKEVFATFSLRAHESIVKLYDVVEDATHVHLIMEFYRGGDLFDALVKQEGGKVPERVAQSVSAQLASALHAAHSRGIIHRDLKPENVFLCDARLDATCDSASTGEAAALRLGDFGLATVLDEGRSTSGDAPVGTPSYMAPEVILGRRFSAKSDMFSLGVVLYVLLSGFLPFGGDEPSETFERVVYGEPRFDLKAWEGVSTEAKSLVMSLLSKDPKKRPSAGDVMNHPWVKTA